MLYLERLKALKEERDLSCAEIAQLSNIPLATITRIFNGQTANPTFETFAQLAVALGASLDEIAGLKVPENPVVETTMSSYAELLREKDERIKEKNEEIKLLRKERKRVLYVFLFFVVFVVTLLMVDIMNGHFGYFRY